MKVCLKSQIRRCDKKDKLLNLGQNFNIWILVLCYISFFGAAQILNVAYTFRNVLYLPLFSMGYYIFSEEKIQQLLQKYNIILLCIGAITGIVQTYISWDVPYQLVVNNWAVILYLGLEISNINVKQN